MSLANVVGLDHFVIVVRDLDAAAQNWRRLGFKVSDRGLHSAHMGTANHTIMLDEDYIELIGVVAPTERNVPTRQFLERRGEGIERAAFTAVSAAGLAQELAARGFPPIGPIAFSRPVDRADGVRTEARFETTQWPVDQRPGGLRIFACQHFTRENVWLPELLGHTNTARRIERLELLSADPAAAAAHMSRMIDRPAEPDDDGAIRVATGGNRADLVFLSRAMLAARHPGVPLDTLPAEGAVTVVVRVEDDDAAAAAVAGRAITREPGLVKVHPFDANGVILVLTTG